MIINGIAAQDKMPMAVIAYYSGKNLDAIDQIEADKLTHIIFSFCHLSGSRLRVDNARDTAVLQKLADLKKKAPDLKVLVSLGGWGGCATCSDVFASAANRQAFARSVQEMNTYFGTDGIDLDWEYPAIEGFPGHKYQPADKAHFTLLVQELRQTLGPQQIISFAAGGFKNFIDSSIDWPAVMKEVDFVNLMTYDLVNGYATTTGHHTPLYATTRQETSVHSAVEQLIALKVPKARIVVGAAFYGRMWEAVPQVANGLYQSGKFKASIPFRNFGSQLSPQNGFVYYWDTTAMAPYLYNAGQKLFVTFDDQRSVALKTKYVKENQLGGIMFWELSSDVVVNGLLDAIDKAKKSN